MRQQAITCTVVLLFIVNELTAISSPLKPYNTYRYSTTFEPNVADLWWTVDEPNKQITFELHVKTTGWIALGISPGKHILALIHFLILYSRVAGGMTGADIGLGWIDTTGRLFFEVCAQLTPHPHLHSLADDWQDRYAYGTMQPVVDNTTVDWFGLQGREENGWTAIQFKRRLDTCDTMDVSIKVSFFRPISMSTNKFVLVRNEHSDLGVWIRRSTDEWRGSNDQLSLRSSVHAHYSPAVVWKPTADEQVRWSRLFRLSPGQCESVQCSKSILRLLFLLVRVTSERYDVSLQGLQSAHEFPSTTACYRGTYDVEAESQMLSNSLSDSAQDDDRREKCGHRASLAHVRMQSDSSVRR